MLCCKSYIKHFGIYLSTYNKTLEKKPNWSRDVFTVYFWEAAITYPSL